MFSGTRDKALQPMHHKAGHWTCEENRARVTQAIPQEFLSRTECALGDYTWCLTQAKLKYFFWNPKRRKKKEAITFFLRGRNEWETGMSKQLAHSFPASRGLSRLIFASSWETSASREAHSEILLALFSDTTYLHCNVRSGSIFVSLCK